jgi:hypothetical protein
LIRSNAALSRGIIRARDIAIARDLTHADAGAFFEGAASLEVGKSPQGAENLN